MRRRLARLYTGQGARDGTHLHTPTPPAVVCRRVALRVKRGVSTVPGLIGTAYRGVYQIGEP